MKKLFLVAIASLMSIIVLAQNSTAVYENRSDIWQASESKITSEFILSLNSSQLSEVKSKLDPLAKEVGYSVSSKDTNLQELTLQFLEGTNPQYLTKILIFLGVDKCMVENEQIDVYAISTLIE